MVVRALRPLGVMARVRQAVTEREVLHQPCVMACVRLGASRVAVLLVVLSAPLGVFLQVLVVTNALSARQANMRTRRLRQHVLYAHMAKWLLQRRGGAPRLHQHHDQRVYQHIHQLRHRRRGQQ